MYMQIFSYSHSATSCSRNCVTYKLLWHNPTIVTHLNAYCPPFTVFLRPLGGSGPFIAACSFNIQYNFLMLVVRIKGYCSFYMGCNQKRKVIHSNEFSPEPVVYLNELYMWIMIITCRWTICGFQWALSIYRSFECSSISMEKSMFLSFSFTFYSISLPFIFYRACHLCNSKLFRTSGNKTHL